MGKASICRVAELRFPQNHPHGLDARHETHSICACMLQHAHMCILSVSLQCRNPRGPLPLKLDFLSREEAGNNSLRGGFCQVLLVP